MQAVIIVLLGFGLSMDTLAISMSIGICRSGITAARAARVGAFFAFFQAAMPVAGYVAGSYISGLIRPYDYWLAFVLLAIIGGRMIYANIHERNIADCDLEPECPPDDPTSAKNLTLMGLATSIDALAAGVSLAAGKTPLVPAVMVIGVITFLVAYTGVMCGRRLGVLLQRNASLAAGVVLILLGVKIVVENLV